MSARNAALQSLKFKPDMGNVEETKWGYVIFSGKPVEYAQWLFRSKAKLMVSTAEDKRKTINSIVESLRGDAMQVAMRIPLETLLAEDGSGAERLMADIKT